jgi:arsenate reductase
MYPDQYDSYSAGTEKTRVHPYAIEVMKEIGIDISKHSSKTVGQFKDKSFDLVITVCDTAKESCPFFPGKKVIHQSFSDPSQLPGTEKECLNAFRKTRDEIQTWIKQTFQNSDSIKNQPIED